MKKLKAIEEKIDLTNKEVENEDETRDFIATNCYFDEKNHLRLIPVVSNQGTKKDF